MAVGTLDAKLQIEYQSAMTAMMAQWKATAKAMEKAMVGIGDKIEKGLAKPLEKSHIAASKTYGYLKDVGRIVQGIFVSQVLYRAILQPIQEAVRELKDFIIQMEQTELAFEMMLGGAEAGQSFVNAMEDFAAVTPFVMEDTTRLARYLLGVGFAAEDVIPLLTKVTDAMAIMGADPEKLTRLVEALGKIKAYGGATLREIKSIARTGLPIVDILTEQLGLTTEQVRDIARLGIPGEVVIEAILAGIQKRFAGGAARLQRTIGGLLSTISDNMMLISKDILAGITEIAQDAVTALADRLEILRSIIREGGVGALFEELIPEDLHETLRLVAANLQAIGREIAILFKSLGPFIREFGYLYTTLNSLLLPIFLQIIRTVSTLLNVISSNTQAVKIFIGALMGMMIAQTIAKAFHMLNTAMIAIYVTMKAIMATNWIGWIGLVVGALAAWALTTDWVQKKLAGLQRTIADIFGFDTEKILQPIVEEADSISGIAAGMSDIDEWVEDIGDSAKGTAKEISKIVASFDEVYDITERKEKAAEKLEFGLDLSGLGKGLDEAKTFGIRTVEELWTGIVDGIRTGRGLKLTSELLDQLDKGMNDYWEKMDMSWEEAKEAYEKKFKEKDLFSFLWEKLKEFWANIKVLGLGEALLEWIDWDTFVERFKGSIEYWKGLWEKIKEWSIWEWLRNVDDLVKEPFHWLEVNIFRRDMTADFKRMWETIQTWAIWDWFRNIKNWEIWQWFKDLPAFAVWTPSFWIEKWKEIQEWSIWEWFRNIENWEIWNWFRDLLPNFDVWKGEWLETFRDNFLTVWGNIKEGLKKIINGIIGIFNWLISGVETMVNSVTQRINALGTIKNPFTGTEYSFGKIPTVTLPRIPEIPRMQAGGVVTKDQIVHVGEQPEIIQPLTERAVQPLANMLVEAMNKMNRQGASDSDYVMVRASKQDLTNLYRSLFAIKKKETIRGLS